MASHRQFGNIDLPNAWLCAERWLRRLVNRHLQSQSRIAVSDVLGPALDPALAPTSLMQGWM
jgi:hypothetical protein